MDLYSWVITNRELIKLLYGIVIGIICLIIVYKTHKIYHLSFHEGIRYFRNAFLFFALAFFIRYLLGGLISFNLVDSGFFALINILFEFFIIMAGFFLLYSLIWKRIDSPKGNFSSVANMRIFIFYTMAIIITLLDFTWNEYLFMFLSQIIIFVIAAIISFVNYTKNGRKRGFLKFYFAAMVLAFFAWILNAVAGVYFNWDKIFLVYVYILNIAIFLLFLIGITIITKKSRKI